MFGSSIVRVVIANPAHIKQILSYKISFLPRTKQTAAKTGKRLLILLTLYLVTPPLSLPLYHRIFFLLLNAQFLASTIIESDYFFLFVVQYCQRADSLICQELRSELIATDSKDYKKHQGELHLAERTAIDFYYTILHYIFYKGIFVSIDFAINVIKAVGHA